MLFLSDIRHLVKLPSQEALRVAVGGLKGVRGNQGTAIVLSLTRPLPVELVTTVTIYWISGGLMGAQLVRLKGRLRELGSSFSMVW